METRKKKIAVVNFESVDSIVANISYIENWLSFFSKRGVDFILFPELNITSYKNSPELHDLWKNEKDDALKALSDVSEKYDIVFSAGLPLDGYISQGVWYNGELVGVHHKTKLGPSEKGNHKIGESVENISVNGLNLGVNICYEGHFPEISSEYENKGSELLCFPYASPRETPEEKLERFKIILRARAYDNSCFACACNSIGKYGDGKKYAGVALIVGPKGEVIAEYCGYEQGYVEAELDFSELDRIRNSKMGYFRSKDNF